MGHEIIKGESEYRSRMGLGKSLKNACDTKTEKVLGKVRMWREDLQKHVIFLKTNLKYLVC